MYLDFLEESLWDEMVSELVAGTVSQNQRMDRRESPLW